MLVVLAGGKRTALTPLRERLLELRPLALQAGALVRGLPGSTQQPTTQSRSQQRQQQTRSHLPSMSHPTPSVGPTPQPLPRPVPCCQQRLCASRRCAPTS
jgi:hypothetical protein